MDNTPMSEQDLLSMSDEDIMNMSFAPELKIEVPEVVEPVLEKELVEVESVNNDVEEVIVLEAPDTSEVITETVTEINDKEKDYKSNYEKIMAPFKANGVDFKLETPEEAVKLMQMGANYTKKMQALQPNLKLIRMLENKGLLDESKLSYLIDLHNKNPEAILKLVKESNIDPLEIDTTKESNYVPSNHSVSDQEIQFNTVLDEVSSTQAGLDIIVAIDKQWDDASKQAIYKEPSVLQFLTQQKENGVYDRIMSEVEKQKILGNLTGMSVIQAYQSVGNHLQKQGVFNTPVEKIVDTRIISSNKTTVTNNDKAKAASPVKTATTKNIKNFNPLSMSDEEFLKLAQN